MEERDLLAEIADLRRAVTKYRDAVEYGDKLHAEIRELKETVENTYDEGYEQGYHDCEEQINDE